MFDMTAGEELQAVDCLVYAVLQSLVAILAVIINGLLLVVLYKNPFKSFRRPFSVLIMALVATDFLKGFLADSISAWIYYQCAFGRSTWLEDDWNFYTFLDYSLDNAATLLVILFTGDRLMALTFPLYYRWSVTRKKTAIAVVLVWIYSFLFSALQFTGIEDMTYDVLDVFLHIVIPMVTMIIIHITIYLFLRQKRKLENAAYANRRNQAPRWVQKNAILEKNFRFVAFLITLTLAISQLPYLCLIFIKWQCKKCWDLEWLDGYELFADFTLCITSALNPMLYCWRVKEYRRSLRALLACKNTENSQGSSTGLECAQGLHTVSIRKPNQVEAISSGQQSLAS